MTCTTPECGRATSLFLCTECIVELDGLLKDVPFFFEGLDPVNQAKKVIKGPGNEGANGTRHGKSKPPLDLDAGQLRTNLAMLPKRAYEVATQDPEAGRTLVMARDWIRKAELLVYGPKPAKETDPEQARARVAQVAPPMPTRQLIRWLREHASIHIKAKDVSNWAARGQLHAVERTPNPTYHPHEIIALYDTKGRLNEIAP